MHDRTNLEIDGAGLTSILIPSPTTRDLSCLPTVIVPKIGLAHVPYHPRTVSVVCTSVRHDDSPPILVFQYLKIAYFVPKIYISLNN
jgi:hypothetical protein